MDTSDIEQRFPRFMGRLADARTKVFHGLHFPEYDTHFTVDLSRKGQDVRLYQSDRLRAALEHVTDFGFAVDAGAHVGLTALQLAKSFQTVIAAEPHPDNCACLLHNTKDQPRIRVLPAAFGATCGAVGIETGPTTNSGDRHLTDDGLQGMMLPIDMLDDLTGLGLLKIDVQGYELEVLKGAYNTICAFAPVILLELEPAGKLRREWHKPDEVMDWLAKLGARKVARIGTDYVYAFGPDGALPYTKYAERGDYHWQRYKQGKNKEEVDKVVALVRDGRHKTIIELGCGDGLWCGLLGAYGIDNNATAIKLARKHGVECRHLSLYKAMSLNKTFDAVCMFDTFEHLHKQDLALKIAAALAPNLYLLNPEPKGVDCHANEMTAQQLADFVTQRGWTIASRTTLPSPRPDRFSQKEFFHLVRA